MWILDDTQRDQAEALVRTAIAAPHPTGRRWRCDHCGEELEKQYLQCWRCASPIDSGTEATKDHNRHRQAFVAAIILAMAGAALWLLADYTTPPIDG